MGNWRHPNDVVDIARLLGGTFNTAGAIAAAATATEGGGAGEGHTLPGGTTPSGGGATDTGFSPNAQTAINMWAENQRALEDEISGIPTGGVGAARATWTATAVPVGGSVPPVFGVSSDPSLFVTSAGSLVWQKPGIVLVTTFANTDASLLASSGPYGSEMSSASPRPIRWYIVKADPSTFLFQTFPMYAENVGVTDPDDLSGSVSVFNLG